MLLELRVENLLLIERAELRLGRGPERDHRRDGGGQDRPRACARSAARWQATTRDRAAGRDGGVGRGRLRPTSAGRSTRPNLADLRERIPAGEEIVLARRVGADGRTRAFVQGRGASAADLRELGGRLVSFYGQHEHRRLTIASAQLEMLDGYCGPGSSRPARADGRRAWAGHSPSSESSPSCATVRAQASATVTCSPSSSTRSTISIRLAPTVPG